MVKLKQEVSDLKREKKIIKQKLSFCCKYFANLKEKVSQLPSQHKKIIKPLLSNLPDGIRRAPSHKLSLFYRKYSTISVKKTGTRSSKFLALKREIISFYLDDANSAPAPGIRGFVTKRRARKRTRYLTDTISIYIQNFVKNQKRKFLVDYFLVCAPSG